MRAFAFLIGVLFAVGAVLAFTGAAHFSHVLGFDGQRHVKHGILYGVLAILAFMWGRMAGARL